MKNKHTPKQFRTVSIPTIQELKDLKIETVDYKKSIAQSSSSFYMRHFESSYTLTKEEEQIEEKEFVYKALCTHRLLEKLKKILTREPIAANKSIFIIDCDRPEYKKIYIELLPNKLFPVYYKIDSECKNLSDKQEIFMSSLLFLVK